MDNNELNYEEMWKGLKNFGDKVGLYDDNVPINYGNLKQLMGEWEEKHFPKLFKKIITFTIEAPTEYYLGTAINDFEMFWANYNGIEGHCAKYSYKNK